MMRRLQFRQQGQVGVVSWRGSAGWSDMDGSHCLAADRRAVSYYGIINRHLEPTSEE